MKKFCLVSLFLLSVAYAGKGSIYSRFGVGEINTLSGGRSSGMGHVGVAVLGGGTINFMNPASIGTIKRTLFSAGYQHRTYSSEDATGTSSIATGTFNEFGVAFPISSGDNIVLSLGALPFSTVGYEQQITQTVAGIQTVQLFEGRGGLTSGQLSLSYSPMTDLYLGMTAHYLFGSIYKDQTIQFNTSGYFNGSYNQTLSMSGGALTVGAIYTGIDQLLGFSDAKRTDLGVTLFSGSSLSRDDETLKNYTSNQDTLLTKDNAVDLPFGFSLGLAHTRNSILYSADMNFQNWSSFTVNGVTPNELRNSLRFGAGVEFLPSDNFTDTFWEKASYRFGGFFRMTNLSVSGQSINEMFGTAGIGLPLSFESRINVALEAGIRGTTSSSLIKDTIIRFTVSVTASELMFIPPVID
jgi:hypothetical protein